MPSDKLPSIQFYPGDWLRDQVSGCSLAAQGLWLRMMFIAHDSELYGYLRIDDKPIPAEIIARKCGASLAEYLALLAELDAMHVPERTPNGIIFSRRMVRDAQRRKLNARNGRKGGNPSILRRDTSELATEENAQAVNRPLKPPVNPPDNPPLKMKLKNEEEIEIPEKLRTEKFAQVFLEWIEHRSQIGHRLTETAAEKQMKQLATWGQERAIVAIEHSIASGWQGIFEPKTNGRHESAPRQSPRTVQVFGEE